MARYTRLWMASGVFSLFGAMLLHLLVLAGNGGVWNGFVHLTLFGWITGFIFAVNYHTLPVFTTRTFPYPRLIGVHWLLFSLGILTATLGLLWHNALGYRLGIGLEGASSLLFTLNVLLLFVRGQKRGQRQPTSAEQRNVDRLSTYATKAAGLGLPLALGLLNAVEYRWLNPRWHLAAEHAATLGWVMLMIIGVAAHVLPRWTGRPFRQVWRLWLALVCHNLALVLMIPALGMGWQSLFRIGGVVMALALGLFGWLIWPNLRQSASTPILIMPTVRSKIG